MDGVINGVLLLLFVVDKRMNEYVHCIFFFCSIVALCLSVMAIISYCVLWPK